MSRIYLNIKYELESMIHICLFSVVSKIVICVIQLYIRQNLRDKKIYYISFVFSDINILDSKALVWIIKLSGIQFMGSQRVRHDLATNTHNLVSFFDAFLIPLSLKKKKVHIKITTSCFANFIKNVAVNSCPTLCSPMNYSVPGSLVRILDWVAISFSMGSS